MSIAIKPGDTLELNCPENSKPNVNVGQIFPEAGKDKSYVIVGVQGNKVTLGPVRAGEFHVNIPCSDGSNLQETFSVKATPQEELPQKQAPVMPVSLSLPLWFWIACLAVLASVGGISYSIYRYFNKKRKPVSQKKEVYTPNGDEILEHYLKTVEGGKWAERDDPHVIIELYAKGNDALRSFLEHRMHFKASWATTSEFLGTLKTSVMGFSGLNDLVHSVETLLTQADLVRFSKDIPPQETRKAFLKGIRKIQADVIRATQVKAP